MRLVLNGGGVGRQVATARKLLNDLIDHNKKILYIPFAWPDPTYKGCLEFMTDELSDVEKSGIEMVTTSKELVDKDFNEYACLYIGGGNTYKLLRDLKASGAFDKIKKYLIENNGIVYGGSAGAIIFGRDLDSCNTDDENEVGLTDNTGFNMINGYSLLCHYTSRDEERTERSKMYLLELSKTKPIYAIPEEDTIYISDGNIEFIGTRPYYKFIDGNSIEYEINNIKFRKISPDEFNKLFDLFPDDEQLWLKYRAKRLKEFNNHETDTYVIENNGKFIGEVSVNYVCHDLPTEAIPNQRAYFQAFRLNKKYQGRGLGQELIRFVLNDLEKMGYTEFTIGVEDDNEIAKHIYFKFGFTEEIDKGHGDEFDPTDYTLYMKSTPKESKLTK